MKNAQVRDALNVPKATSLSKTLVSGATVGARHAKDLINVRDARLD